MKIVQLSDEHLRTLEELARMVGSHFDAEFSKEIEAVWEDVEKQLSEDGPQAKLKAVLESLRSFKARWWDPGEISDVEEMWLEGPMMVVCAVPLMEDALGVERAKPCECDCGHYKGHEKSA